ncbi:hypothetical protein [Marinifilum fragile]
MNFSRYNLQFIIKLSAVIFLVFSHFSISAQEKYSVTGKVKIENGSIDNTFITIYENAVKLESKLVDNNGKFTCDLDFGNDYIFEFSKEGFVTKKVSVSTFVPEEVLSRDSQFPPFKFTVSLFPAYEGLDLSIFDQPMGMIMYDKELDNFDYDRGYDSQIRDAIQKAEAEARRRAAELEAQRLAKEKAYKAAIQKGDINFRGKKYEEAKMAYNEAIAVMAEEQYPKSQIAKIDELLAEQQRQAEEASRLAAEQKVLDEKYASIISLADSQFESGDYTSAKTSYSDALALKTEEEYPKLQITKIDELLAEQQRQAEEAARLAAEQKALNEKYAAIITLADSQFESGDYTSAKTSYSDALELKEEEPYPKSQIAKVDELLAEQQRQAEEAARLAAEQKALDDKYASIITLADSQFESGDYASAKTSYSDALSLKAEEPYPKSQIAKIDELLAERQRQAEEAARLAAEKKALDEKYASIITLADSQFESGDYASAKTSYSDALSLKSEEPYPKSQIAKIDELLAERQRQAEEAARLAAEKKALDEKYASIITLADSQFESGDYTSSKSSYSEAVALKSEEQYPKNQITKIDELLVEQQRQAEEAARLAAEKKALDEKYASIITLADSQFESGDYTSSKTSYSDALALKSEEQYPKSQIAKIDELLAEQQRQAELAARLAADQQKQAEEDARLAAEQKALDEKYASIIALADSQFESGDYTSSKTSYSDALALKSEEQYPKSQIAKIDELLAEQQRQAELAARLAADQQKQAEEAARLVAEQKALDEKYASIIALADSQFESGDYTSSKTSYSDALALKSEEQYPKSQIAKIDELLAEQQRQAELAARLAADQQKQAEEDARLAAEQKALDEKYASIIALADSQFESGDYTSSKTSYSDALALKSEEQYPKSQIAKIDELLAEQQRQAELAARLAADQQKQAEEDARLVAEQKALDEKYASIIALADSQFESGDYTSSKTSYSDALALKSEEQYPKSQIAKIDELLSDQQKRAEEAARLAAEQKALDEKYASSIAMADAQFKNKEYDLARESYKDALNMKPAELYPREQLKKISEIFAMQKIQAEEEAKLLAQQQLNETKYLKLIQSADEYFESEKWNSAARDYHGALKLKPEEQYTQSKIDEIEAILAELERKANAKSELKSQYDKLIEIADKQYANEEYDFAVLKYQEALELMPKESYPKTQIKRIEVILERRAIAEKKEQELNLKYSEELEKAEDFFKNEQFSVARHHYKAALEIKPKETYPKEKLEEINERLQALKNAEQEAIANNPTNFEKKLSIIKEREYAELIQKADNAFQNSQFTVSKVMYERALGMFDREYPKKQLKEIDKLIRDERNSALSEEYKQLIAKGDEELSANHYAVAKFYYNKAIALNKKEKYPKNQLKKIDELLKSKKDLKLDKEYDEIIAKADSAFDKGNLTVARFYYKKALQLKSGEDYPKERLKMIQSKRSKK